jgi:NAD(P)H-dependent FMN reductase
MSSHVRILGIAGSLRRGSYNQAALRAAKLLGAIGTAAQQHLRQILVALNLFTLNQPEVVIADAAHRFDENGNLIHEPTKQLIQELLKNLVDWTRRISPALAREASP